jgi:hypothetical protein
LSAVIENETSKNVDKNIFFIVSPTTF